MDVMAVSHSLINYNKFDEIEDPSEEEEETATPRLNGIGNVSPCCSCAECCSAYGLPMQEAAEAKSRLSTAHAIAATEARPWLQPAARFSEASAVTGTASNAVDGAARESQMEVADQGRIPAVLCGNDSSSNRGNGSSTNSSSNGSSSNRSKPPVELYASHTGSTAGAQHDAAHINPTRLYVLQNEYISAYLDRKGLKLRTPSVLRMLDEYRSFVSAGHDDWPDESPDEAILRIFVDLQISIDVTDAPTMPVSLPPHMQHQQVTTAAETSSDSDWSLTDSEESDEDALPDLLPWDAYGAVRVSTAPTSARQPTGSRENSNGSLPGALRELDTSTESEHSSYDDDYEEDDAQEELPNLAPSLPWQPEHEAPARTSSAFSFTPFANAKTPGPIAVQPEPAADLSRAAASTATPWLVHGRNLHTSSKRQGSHQDEDDGAVNRIMYDDNSAVIGIMGNGTPITASSLDALGQLARPPASAAFRVERRYGFSPLPAPQPKQLDPPRHAHQGRLDGQPASAELRAFSKLLAEHGLTDMQAAERMEVQFSDGRAVTVAGMYQDPQKGLHQPTHQGPHQAPVAVPAEALHCIPDVLEQHMRPQFVPNERSVRIAGMHQRPRQGHHIQFAQHAQRAKQAQRAQQASEATRAEMASLAELLAQHGVSGMQATDHMALHFSDGSTRKVSGMYQIPVSADSGHLRADSLESGADEGRISEWFDNVQLGSGSTRPGSGSTRLGGGSTRLGIGSTTLGAGRTRLGCSSPTRGSGSIVFGGGSTKLSSDSTTLGSGSTRLGCGSTTLGSRSITLGVGSTLLGGGSTKLGNGSTMVSRGREWEVAEAMKVLGLDNIPGITPDLFMNRSAVSGLELAAAALGHPATSRDAALSAGRSPGPPHGQDPLPRSLELSGPASKWHALADTAGTVDRAAALTASAAGAEDSAGAGAAADPVPRSPELSGPIFKWYALAGTESTMNTAGALAASAAGAVDSAGAGAAADPVPRSPEMSGPIFKWYALADTASTMDTAAAVAGSGTGAVDTAGIAAGSSKGMSGAMGKAKIATTAGNGVRSHTIDDDDADDDDADDDDLPEMYTSTESDESDVSTDDGFVFVK